jgi:hypothetical protein
MRKPIQPVSLVRLLNKLYHNTKNNVTRTKDAGIECVVSGLPGLIRPKNSQSALKKADGGAQPLSQPDQISTYSSINSDISSLFDAINRPCRAVTPLIPSLHTLLHYIATHLAVFHGLYQPRSSIISLSRHPSQTYNSKLFIFDSCT